ncbi:neprilysin-1-like isoform X1 [Dermacentor silvarum]|uniref:neprilysin-1-like isoform X1 n=1 Tax=Dermacentor silvarum TaxID=543639 RepID=UPI002101693D|nr:neprilysin-1-like isoform X1 [Dermacentor silvarum]
MYPFVFQVEKISVRLKEVFNDSLQGATWMDTENKMKALQKLQKMVAKIGYSPWLLNTTVLQHLYKYVPSFNQSTSFLKMMYLTNENNDIIMMERLRQEYDTDSDWHLSFSTVTTHYDPSSNEFVCPMAGMQSPFYQFGLPWSLNVGAIGSVIAHEMTHGFTGRGSYYDADGRPRPIWPNSKYKTKTECFVQQYEKITDEETNIPINGTQTLDENIADNSGLELAYAAYRRMVEEDCDNTTTTLESLPDFTGPQLFFIGNAMSWCSVVKAGSFRRPVPYMRYSPSKYRVNLPMQNLPEFATAFNCSSESAMYKNSTETCSLWRPTLTTE